MGSQGKKAPARLAVLGWYGKGNIGDEAFKDALRHLWPKASLSFFDRIPADINSCFDALWIGGGSFLDQVLPGIDQVTIPIGFIGVGVGSRIEPANQRALDRAKIVIVRDPSSQKDPRWHVVGDLVLGLPLPAPRVPGRRAIVTIFLNDFITPRQASVDWQVSAYENFMQVFPAFCDDLIEQSGYEPHFFPMCMNHSVDDFHLSRAVIAKMRHADHAVCHIGQSVRILNHLLEQSDCVLTQRLHGAIFSALHGCPFVMLSLHDKMHGFAQAMRWRASIDYYGVTSSALATATASALQQAPFVLGDLRTQILQPIQEQWKCMQRTVAETFSL